VTPPVTMPLPILIATDRQLPSRAVWGASVCCGGGAGQHLSNQARVQASQSQTRGRADGSVTQR
jgi:hypothetical protein